MSEKDTHTTEFEEVNTFPEKVGGEGVPSDDSDVIFWDPDADTIARSSKLEEQRSVPENKVSSFPINDEVPQKKTMEKSLPDQPQGIRSDFESLALDIDSMDRPAGEDGLLAHSDDDFLSVLDDDQLNMIDEVVQRSSESYNEITATPAAIESDSDEHISLIVEERLVESKPLWSDDDDFWLNDAEGFDVPPHELIEYLCSGGAAARSMPKPEHSEAAAESPAVPEAPAVESAPVDAEHPYIIKSGEGEVLINVAALIDPAKSTEVSPVAEEFPVAEEKLARIPSISEIEIPIIIVEPDYLSDDEEKKAASPAAAEGLRDGRTIELSPRTQKNEAAAGGSDGAFSTVKNRLPADFTITHLDLSEAEKIAKEDIFLLNEDDLIEELEQIDLVPLELEVPVVKDPEKNIQPPVVGGNFTYLTPEKSTLFGDVKDIVEKEIKTPTALIIEEDIEDIKATLKGYTDVPSSSEELVDITDRIVLLEDEADVDRFVAAIPEEKRHEMKKLLSYLDGLFDRLPEDVVKTFADSEYFDLYVKIMNDLGE